LKALIEPLEDKERFIQTVEQELINLHEGNFARYFVTPSEFRRWQKPGMIRTSREGKK
jgi:hypothetical protein